MSQSEFYELQKLVKGTAKSAWLGRALLVLVWLGGWALMDSHNDSRYIKAERYTIDEKDRAGQVVRAAEDLKIESQRLQEIEQKRVTDHDTLIQIKTVVDRIDRKTQ